MVCIGHGIAGSLNNLHDKEMFLIIPGKNRNISKILTFFFNIELSEVFR